jgi:DNA-binding response OmpR family regulator
MATQAPRSLSMAILLADDDVQLATFLSKSLESEGYAVHTALNEGSALEELRRQNYQLIILDLNFGQTDGLQLLERLRARGLETPVIVLSARDRVTDRIKSLNLGADDYITKPFSFQELAARANALLRRKADPALSVLRIENLELDPASRKVRRGSRDIKLSPREFDLLYLLMRRGGDTVSRHELLKECWGQENDTDSNLVDVYVNYLRRKIDLAEDEKLIYTVRGSGYRLGKAPLGAGLEFGDAAEDRAFLAGDPYPSQALSPTDITLQQTPLRVLIHSLAHDLAQPLTSVRCYLEMLSVRGANLSPDDKDLKIIEQQADRAVSLTKGISALVREVPLSNGPWISVDSLLNDVFHDFIALQNAGLLVLDRQWDPAIQVTSAPVLRQLCILIVAKIAGKNTAATKLTISAKLSAARCDLSFIWMANGNRPGLPAKGVINETLPYLQEMVDAIGCEMSVPEDQAEITLRVPAGPLATGTRQGTIN